MRFDSTDADSNGNGLVMFRIVSSSTDAANFSLTATGVLVNTDTLPPDNYTVGIEAFDAGSNNSTSTSNFTLMIVSDTSKFASIVLILTLIIGNPLLLY